MSGHTAGPWKVEGDGVSAHHAANDPRCEYWICDRVYGDRRACAVSGRPSDNARLIAAAPDLLEACLLARHVCEEGNALQQQIDAAIAKATS